MQPSPPLLWRHFEGMRSGFGDEQEWIAGRCRFARSRASTCSCATGLKVIVS